MTEAAISYGMILHNLSFSGFSMSLVNHEYRPSVNFGAIVSDEKNAPPRPKIVKTSRTNPRKKATTDEIKIMTTTTISKIIAKSIKLVLENALYYCKQKQQIFLK